MKIIVFVINNSTGEQKKVYYIVGGGGGKLSQLLHEVSQLLDLSTPNNNFINNITRPPNGEHNTVIGLNTCRKVQRENFEHKIFSALNNRVAFN